MRNADAFKTQTLVDDEVRQRGMTVPGHEDINFVNQNGQLVRLSGDYFPVCDKKSPGW